MTRAAVLAMVGILATATTGAIACGTMPWQNRPSCTSTFEPPTRMLTVIFWHAGGTARELALSFDDEPLSGRLRIYPARAAPAVAAECSVAIPTRAGKLRACAARTRRCTVLALPAGGDLWIQLGVEDPDSVVVSGGPELLPPAID